jgi:hypothetical protein
MPKVGNKYSQKRNIVALELPLQCPMSPICIRYGGPATEFLERKLSESVIRRVDRFPVSMIPGVSDLSIIDTGRGGSPYL